MTQPKDTQNCTEEFCGHKECWDLARSQVREQTAQDLRDRFPEVSDKVLAEMMLGR